MTATGKALSLAGLTAVLDDLKVGASRVGAFMVPMVLAFNGQRADLLKARMQVRADPQRAAELMRPFERLKDIRSAVGNPDFRSAEIVAVPTETFATVQGLANAEAALVELQKRSEPFSRTTLKQIGAGKFDVTVEIKP